MSKPSRRLFLRQTAAGVLCLAGILQVKAQAAASRSWRAAIIGATGRGDYGHHLERAFEGIENVEVAAVADRDAAGRSQAAERAGAQRQYADYREMLDREQPNLVVVAPRWTDQRPEMARAALEAGAHLLTEKPFTSTLTEADEILALANRAHRKISVAHQMRLAPNVVHLRRAVEAGLIGDLVQMRAWGKQDHRSGGEDMLVLGTHLFDMMRLFAGDALSCHAHVLAHGKPIGRQDGRQATEQIGPVGGDEVEADFLFGNGIIAHFTSRARLRETLGHWALELIGSKGVVRVFMDIDPVVLQRRREGPPRAGEAEGWQPLPGDPTLGAGPEQRGFGPANRRVVDEWLEAIRLDREPPCSGVNAMKALEMVMAVYESAVQQDRVLLPLARRTHPLP